MAFSSERLHELDECALVGIGQHGAEVVALVFDEVGAGIERVEVGSECEQPLRGGIVSEPLVVHLFECLERSDQQRKLLVRFPEAAELQVGIRNEIDGSPLWNGTDVNEAI